MPDRTMMIDGVRVPRLFYGTAWKEDETTRLAELYDRTVSQIVFRFAIDVGMVPLRRCIFIRPASVRLLFKIRLTSFDTSRILLGHIARLPSQVGDKVSPISWERRTGLLPS